MRLAVLGSPIAHSKSPLLHGAAYAQLGLDWSYEAIEVSEEMLAEFVRTRDSSWRGLSLTMPLKRAVLPLLATVDELVAATGSANTVLFDRAGGDLKLRGFNTDVYGIIESFRAHGVGRLTLVHILGGGATAASAIAAVARLGAERVVVWVRTPDRSAALVGVGRAVGVDVEIAALSAVTDSPVVPDAVISTLPHGADAQLEFDATTRASSILFDVAYEPWPTPLAGAWIDQGGRVIPGIDMLVNQALVQVRIFVNSDPGIALENEKSVLAAMRSAVGA